MPRKKLTLRAARQLIRQADGSLALQKEQFNQERERLRNEFYSQMKDRDIQIDALFAQVRIADRALTEIAYPKGQSVNLEMHGTNVTVRAANWPHFALTAMREMRELDRL